jgi:glycosylphosphatidylinositol transamidase (GPIT) subunit GPI8
MLVENNIGNVFSEPGVQVGMFDENDHDIVIADARLWVEYIQK